MSHHHHHDTTHIDWNDMGPQLERGAELHRPLYEQAAAWIGEQVPAAAVRRILDIGSGPGVISSMLADAFPYAEVVAVDGTPELLERARARDGRLHTRVAQLPDDIDELGEADLIWAGNAVHHLGDQGAALTTLARLLRPGGLIAVAEGGLRPRHLPRDLGFGRPGLEGRLDVAHAEWFAQMRESLPGATAQTEDWRALLAAAGLTPGATRSFLLDIPAPVPAAVREHVVATFAWLREGLAGQLSADDTAALDRLLDPDDKQGLTHRPDCYLLAARTVFTARRA
ncbi:class I SAM-dependent methyltransferase [Streptomyces sp. NPDC000410]|uniref:class I SAM-dependent methyltransferase n=1 Tax=Streptomyces sp. NPDC000410 TaxID=3154254 RepID=UPI00331D18B6